MANCPSCQEALERLTEPPESLLSVSGRAASGQSASGVLDCHLILEVKGLDPLEEVKKAAAERWVAAVNAEGSYGHWRYALVKDPSDINPVLGATLPAGLLPLGDPAKRP